MIKAYLISTGTELVLGNTLDTNAPYLANRLAEMGIKVIGKSVVGDNPEMIKSALSLGLEKADLVIISGGLGPTRDDLTREMVAECLGLPLEIREEEIEKIKDYFARRKRVMPESNVKQAMFPQGAEILENPAGTAPGFIVFGGKKVVIALPGPPKELKEMFEKQVEKRLKELVGDRPSFMVFRTLKVIGLGESQVEELIDDVLQNPRGCGIALLAKEGEVHVRVSCESGIGELRDHLPKVVETIKERLGEHVYSEGEENLAEAVVRLLKEAKATLALAESCTGGLVGKLVTDVPGSSQVFWGGATTYSNEAKTKILGVKEETLKEFGAVSQETAREMAQGIRCLSGATIGLSLTGIAGPEGGTDLKPVGLVYLGVAMEGGTLTKEMRFLGDRGTVRTLAAKSALDWIRRILLEGKNKVF